MLYIYIYLDSSTTFLYTVHDAQYFYYYIIFEVLMKIFTSNLASKECLC